MCYLEFKEIMRRFDICDEKLDRLLAQRDLDLSREDASVRSTTDQVEAAIHQIPPQTSTTNQEGK